MRNIICILFILLSFVLPSQALASGFMMNVQVIRQDDGTTSGELWYNDKVVWRLSILTDGAKPVSGSHNAATTLIIPDIINGMLLIKIQ